MRYFRYLKRLQKERLDVESSLERVILRGGYQRLWAEEAKKILEVEIVCE